MLRANCDISIEECPGSLDDTGVFVNEIAGKIDAGYCDAMAGSETNGLGQFLLQSGLVNMDPGELQAVVAELAGGLECLFQGTVAEGVAMEDDVHCVPLSCAEGQVSMVLIECTTALYRPFGRKANGICQ